MSAPFYVSPEQLMKDRADYARKGIARGRSNVVLQYADGILFVAENASKALHKISEVYDRIAFAAVGRYNEFENLRVAGVRLADLTGYTYDRRDVTGRTIANAYAQTLGAIFSGAGEKPYEVEIVVAEVGDDADGDTMYRLTYDGSVADEHGFVAMGGQAEHITGLLKERYVPGASLAEALRLAVDVLTQAPDGEMRALTAGQLEVAALVRSRSRRTFRRYVGPQLEALLAASSPHQAEAQRRRRSPPAADDQADSPGGVGAFGSVRSSGLTGPFAAIGWQSAHPRYATYGKGFRHLGSTSWSNRPITEFDGRELVASRRRKRGRVTWRPGPTTADCTR